MSSCTFALSLIRFEHLLIPRPTQMNEFHRRQLYADN